MTVIIGHLLYHKTKTLRIFLLLASYYFYSVYNTGYLILIFLSTMYDYIAGLGIESYRLKTSNKNLFSTQNIIYRSLGYFSDTFWIVISLLLNLSLLGFFKYTNFGLEVFNDVFQLNNSLFRFTFLDIFLPVGISFYTFQSLSYTIDVYRGILKARKNFIDFALFIAFFPQLVAGPIVRATTFFSQMDQPGKIFLNDYIVGFTRIISGFFRKMVLADNLAPVVNTVFANPQDHNTLDIWIASIGFGWQIYFDFAGYTDIARGVARFFGYEFEINFACPMAARNITEHWKRWHISLTTWLRDYLYIPLGGSRVSQLRLYLNISIVWLFTGIWHGAAYHFIAWGIWQYIMIIIHRFYSASSFADTLRSKLGRFWEILARIILFICLNFGFIWFRAENMTSANYMIGRLYFFENINESFKLNFNQVPSLYNEYLLFLALLWIYEFFMDKYKLDQSYETLSKNLLILVLSLKILSIVFLSPVEVSHFLYFQF